MFLNSEGSKFHSRTVDGKNEFAYKVVLACGILRFSAFRRDYLDSLLTGEDTNDDK